MYAIESRGERAVPAAKELQTGRHRCKTMPYSVLEWCWRFPLCMKNTLRGKDLRDDLYLLPVLGKAVVSLKGCESMNAV